MEIMLVLVLSIIWAACAVGLLCVIVSYFCHRDRKNITLKFNDFQKYYEINPSRYGFGDNNPWVRHGDMPDIQFGFIDYIRYRVWKYSLEKREALKYENARMSEYLDVVMQDVQAAKRRANQEIQDACREISSIIETWR